LSDATDALAWFRFESIVTQIGFEVGALLGNLEMILVIENSSRRGELASISRMRALSG